MQALCIKKHEVDICVIGGGIIPLSTYHSERKTNDYGSSTAHIFNFEIL